ncbi:uncharacterized protein LOC129981780 isoform X1 [Argiope bruennichi]|uniref:uncharacterized protein LOC129981780 isoform X1 n=1 Tax=Argiope bruennichi TaxID=94029 RepID=UPI002494C1CE|nr:uncharacterized protein LOC129981780 isoform X1 [Argiope bruennichi]
MHDDPSRNRVFVTEDHSLVIRQVQPQDGAYYFCYDVGSKKAEEKMDILLDIERRTTLEPRVLRLPVNINREVSKWLKSCEKIISPVVKAETKRGKEGARLTLFCPGSHHQFRYTDAYPAVQLHPVGDSHDSEVEELHDAAEGAADEERGRLAVGKPTEFCKQ